jgi:hypothetical protein
VDLVFDNSTPQGSTVTVRCTNGSTGEWVEETYTLNFTSGGGGGSLTIVSPSSLPNGQETVSYGSVTITAQTTGTTGPYSWSLSSGTLPTGLTLDTAATGLTTTISGTPATGTANTYTIDVTITDGSVSDTKTYQFDITAAGTLTITTSSLADGTVGTAYSANIDAVGGTGPYTWSLASGTLPASLTLGTSTTSTVSISGTPTAAGTSNFTVQVDDSLAATDTQAFTLTVNTGGGGGGPGGLSGGGGGGGGGGCVAVSGGSAWLLLLSLAGLFGLAWRRRRA